MSKRPYTPSYFYLIFSALLINLFYPYISHGSSPKIILEKIDRDGINRLLEAGEGPHVIIVMASWCGPCREELPALIKLYSKYKPYGLKMVGLSFEFGGCSTLMELLEKARVNFPVYWAEHEVLFDYDIPAIPVLLLIKNGKIVAKIVGKRDEDFLDKKIRSLIGVQNNLGPKR
ncbi:MAG: TlpA disulfide reductase family protein [Pseudomonadota bacterium]